MLQTLKKLSVSKHEWRISQPTTSLRRGLTWIRASALPVSCTFNCEITGPSPAFARRCFFSWTFVGYTRCNDGLQSVERVRVAASECSGTPTVCFRAARWHSATNNLCSFLSLNSSGSLFSSGALLEMDCSIVRTLFQRVLTACFNVVDNLDLFTCATMFLQIAISWFTSFVDSPWSGSSQSSLCLATTLLHCALASCGAVYCNQSCLWVCDSGRAGGRCPNLTTASACAVFASLWALFSFSLGLRLWARTRLRLCPAHPTMTCPSWLTSCWRHYRLRMYCLIVAQRIPLGSPELHFRCSLRYAFETVPCCQDSTAHMALLHQHAF